MDRSIAPLMLQVELTPEQRHMLLAQVGLDLRAVPFRSAASFARCMVGGVRVHVERGVFVPTASADRMLAVMRAAASSQAEPIVVDVGTGAGALALAFAVARPEARVFGTEISSLALRCARRNRARLRVHNVRILRGSLLEPLPARLRQRVTIVAANLPYLPPALSLGAEHLFPEHTALGAGADGLDLMRQLARSARAFLAPGGTVVLQLALAQWPAFEAELAALRYSARLVWEGEARGPAVVRADWKV